MKKIILCTIGILLLLVGTAGALPMDQASYTHHVGKYVWSDFSLNIPNQAPDGFYLDSFNFTHYSLGFWGQSSISYKNEYNQWVELGDLTNSDSNFFLGEKRTDSFALPVAFWGETLSLGIDMAGPIDFGKAISVTTNHNRAAPVPEPGTIVLMGLGLVGIAGLGLKRRKKLTPS